MSIEASIPVTVASGTLEYQKAWMDSLIMSLDDGRYILAFIHADQDATKAQHAYYRGVVLRALANEAADGSYSRDEWHDILGSMFRSHEYTVNGQLIQAVKSTSDMGVAEMSQYIDTCIRYAAQEWGMAIPEAARVGL